MANLTDIFPAPASNNILEYLSATADGRSVTVGSGTYTFQNVTGEQCLSTSHQVITGSSISYVPPSEAKYVYYEFNCKIESTARGGISGFITRFNGTNVSIVDRGWAGNYSTSEHHLNEFMHTSAVVFDLTVSTTNIAQAKIAPSDWTIVKTLDVTGREYDNSSYQCCVHGNHYEDGAGASGNEVYTKPTLTIIAYG